MNSTVRTTTRTASMFATAEHERPGDARSEALGIRWSEFGLIVAFWLLFALVTIANRVLDPRRPNNADVNILFGTIAIALTQATLWAVLTVPLFILAARSTIDQRSRAARALLLVGAVLLVALLTSTISDLAREQFFPISRFNRGGGGGGGPRHRHWWSFSIGGFQFINDVVMGMGVLAGGFARAFSISSRARQEQATRLKAQLAEVRLDALRRQLDPHFLFNTLHAVSSLVERDPRGVRRMIARLSELLRHSIEDANEPEIALRKELELLTRYIEIMQVRFQGKLAVDTHIDPDVLDALVPNMILQPLVENAIKHGVEKLTSDGRIGIDVERAGATLILRVTDNGPGPSDGTPLRQERAGGVGVRNTIARLEQLYGTEQAFTLRAGEHGGTVAEVRLPYHGSAELRTVGVARPSAGLPNG